MKKLLAFLLILAMLIPMGIVAQAEETEIRPYYMQQWDGFTSDLSNVYNMTFCWTNPGTVGQTLECVYAYGSYSIPEIAQAMKEDFNARPDGTRYMNFGLVAMAFHTLAEDVIFVEKAVAVVQEWLNTFLVEYQRIGGKLDGLILDIEFENLYATYIQSRFSVDNPFVYKEIVENPIYTEKIRPALVERGFKFYENITDYTPEIYSIHSKAGDAYSNCRGIWDAVVRSYMNAMATEACAPLWDYYPEAEMNDYTSKNVDAWLKELSDAGGLQDGYGGNYTTCGTSCNENFYSVRLNTSFKDPSTNMPYYLQFPGYNRAVFENKPFNYFMYEANIFKNTYLACDDGEITFWIAHYMYNLENENSVSLTPYYVEQLLHMGLLNPQCFIGYIIRGELNYEEDYEFCLQVVDDVLKELTRVAGAADRKPIQVTPGLNEHYVLSGITAGGKNIWRITPDTSLVSVADFKVEGVADPTFYVNGQTVTFPQGKIVEDGSIRGYEGEENIIYNNTCGYWVETPVDVVPITTRADNYHSEYPAYGEDYEAYQVGMEYNYKNALPETCWEAKKSGNGTATVVADPTNADNNVLALTGGYTLRNVTLPKLISAGDSYAENQIWEVEITIPSDMPDDAELVLLNASGDKKKTNDGGFQVVGTKVYYCDNGTYAELSGVTLKKGETYRFVRRMDFNNAEALNSDYYVYSADGKLLGSAKDVVMSEMDLPVAGVGIRCTGITGEALLVDNYKLYPTSVGYDFELYDMKTGIKATDPEALRTSNTVFRLSWLNATANEKTYTAIAAFYEGDKLVEEKVIKEIKMAANFEGVDYGTVEVAEGQSVRVYLRNDNPDGDDGIPAGTVRGDRSGISTTLLIFVIADIAILVAVVIALLRFNKKAAKAMKLIKKAAKK